MSTWIRSGIDLRRLEAAIPSIGESNPSVHQWVLNSRTYARSNKDACIEFDKCKQDQEIRRSKQVKKFKDKREE